MKLSPLHATALSLRRSQHAIAAEANINRSISSLCGGIRSAAGQQAPVPHCVSHVPVRTKTKFVDSPLGIVEDITGDTVIVRCKLLFGPLSQPTSALDAIRRARRFLEFCTASVQLNHPASSVLCVPSLLISKPRLDLLRLFAALSRATPNCLVTFQNGAAGIAIDLRRDGSARVALVNGTPAPRETAAADAGPATISACRGYIDRVVDALGQPIDGLGSIETNGDERQQALFAAGSPPIIARQTASAVIATGVKAVDTFQPIIRGHSTVVVGERGIGKGKFAMEVMQNVAKCNEAAAAMMIAADDRAAAGSELLPSSDLSDSNESPESLPAITAAQTVIIYVSIGANMNTLKGWMRQMKASGVMEHVCVVAAPAGSPAGAQYMAPFTGTYSTCEALHARVSAPSLGCEGGDGEK